MKSRGQRTHALTEFVDIYPTLCELAGLDKPEHLEGTSMVPLMGDPGMPWKKAAFSQYPRQNIMGYTMRTERYRYTEWRNLKSGEIKARELYDHEKNPDESANVADAPENKQIVADLSRMLRNGYQTAKP